LISAFYSDVQCNMILPPTCILPHKGGGTDMACYRLSK
jgi:hypothetical protein